MHSVAAKQREVYLQMMETVLEILVPELPIATCWQRCINLAKRIETDPTPKDMSPLS